LSLPVLLPILLIMVKITAVSIGILEDTSLETDFIILLGIDMLSIGLSLILFPYLWRN
jgi:heme exporter protein B